MKPTDLLNFTFSSCEVEQPELNTEYSNELKVSDIENMTFSCCEVANKYNNVKNNVWIDAISQGDILR